MTKRGSHESALPRALEKRCKLTRCLIQTAYFALRLFLAFRLLPKRSKYLGIAPPSDSDDRGDGSGSDLVDSTDPPGYCDPLLD